MLLQTDFTLFDRHRKLVALVEAKNKRGTTPAWAAEYRRNLLSHNNDLGTADFFVMATPDRLYVWKGTGSEPAVLEPTYTIDALPVFEPYFRRAGISPDEVDAYTFEFIVGAWLSELTLGHQEPASPSWLLESKFLDSVREGRLSYENAA
jgi:hypothetical protein